MNIFMCYTVVFGNLILTMTFLLIKKTSPDMKVMPCLERLLIEFLNKSRGNLNPRQKTKWIMKTLSGLCLVKKIKQQCAQYNIGLRLLILMIIGLLLPMKWNIFMKNKFIGLNTWTMNLFFFLIYFVKWMI